MAPRALMRARRRGVVGLVGDHDGILPNIPQKEIGTDQIVGLAWSDQDLDRPTLVVDADMDFRRQPSSTSPNTTISTLFLTPEAC